MPWEALRGHAPAFRQPSCVSSASPRPEEPRDSVWLPRSFTGLHASSGFYFRTHKGQSQSLSARMEKCMPGAAGFPSLLGPTNWEAGTSNPSSTAVDTNPSPEPQGAARYRTPSRPQKERKTTSHSSSAACRPPHSSRSLNQWEHPGEKSNTVAIQNCPAAGLCGLNLSPGSGCC